MSLILWTLSRTLPNLILLWIISLETICIVGGIILKEEVGGMNSGLAVPTKSGRVLVNLIWPAPGLNSLAICPAHQLLY